MNTKNLKMLQELNDANGASILTSLYSQKCLKEFDGHLIGAEFGVAYGGGIARIGKDWKDRGTVYGFDTFEGHPKEIIDLCRYTQEAGSNNSIAATCMDYWYRSDEYGTQKIKYEYIKEQLELQELNNVKLVKCLITSLTNIDFIPYLNYCLLDLDYPLSMMDAWHIVKNKIVKGGYLCLHDVIPKGHIHGLWENYQEMISEDLYEIIIEDRNSLLSVLRKK
jgi:hypothetical protein